MRDVPQPRLPHLILIALALGACSRITPGTYEGECDFRGTGSEPTKTKIQIVVMPKAAQVQIVIQGNPSLTCLHDAVPNEDAIEVKRAKCEVKGTGPNIPSEAFAEGKLHMRAAAITRGSLKVQLRDEQTIALENVRLKQ
jgi:hypothetical protein